MKNSIHCLLVSGGSLDNGVRDALYLTACRMIRRRKIKARFTDENAQGVVETAGKRSSLSSAVFGIEFTATVDCKQGNSLTCKFLVNDIDMLSEDQLLEGPAIWVRGVAGIPTDDEDDEGEEWKKGD